MVMLRGDLCVCQQKHSYGASHWGKKACLDCLFTKNLPEVGLERAGDLSTIFHGSTPPPAEPSPHPVCSRERLPTQAGG